MGNPDTPNAPAGWYPDPDNSLQQKYWDGSKWVESFSSNPTGADYWEGRSQENLQPPNRQVPQKQPSRSKYFWPLLISIGIAALIAFQSCESRGWQMGVDGNGYQVTCKDGTISMSGGIQGACSQHGGIQ